MRIGAHMTISKGMTAAIRDALSINSGAYQFFTRNPRGGGAKTLQEDDLRLGWELLGETGVIPVAHAPYTVNLISQKEETAAFALRTVREDLERTARLGSSYLVLHPGAHQGAGEDEGLKRLVAALDRVWGEDCAGETMILLETMAGQGSEICSSFESMGWVFTHVSRPERLGVCLDTCHVTAAGYSLEGGGLEETMDKFQETVGLERLRVIHLNDCKYPRGSRRDRHAGLGEGCLGWETIVGIVSHPTVRELPFILETPRDLRGWAEEIRGLSARLGR